MTIDLRQNSGQISKYWKIKSILAQNAQFILHFYVAWLNNFCDT